MSCPQCGRPLEAGQRCTAPHNLPGPRPTAVAGDRLDWRQLIARPQELRPPVQRRLTLDLDHFRARVLQDALSEATAAYWRRRAATFLWAAPRPGDFTGQASADELAEQAEGCQATAEACLAHAELLANDPPPWWAEEIDQALEVA